MKIIRFPDKKYSWLQWPVTLKGCFAPHLHVTAKFFGEAQIDQFAVFSRCPAQLNLWVPQDFAWLPCMFSQGHVLHLTKCPKELFKIHDEFSIIKDQFEPWRPHISVPRNYWIDVDEFKRTPVDEELMLGELELCLGSNINRPDGQGE
jgi:hypothetical protein